MDFHQQVLAHIKARGKQTQAEVKAWGDGLRAKYAQESEQFHRDDMEKMQRNHDDEMERMKSASEQRVNDYREQSFANIEQPTFSEQPEEVEYMEDDLADELAQRMNEHD